MADSSAAPSPSSPRSRVVHSLARAAERPCARPGCPAPARATLTFSYATAEAHLDRLSDVADPSRYDLCARHATRTEPPRGWTLTDRRPDEDRVETEPPPPSTRDLGSEATVAVLAAALRAVPETGAPARTSGAAAGAPEHRSHAETSSAPPADPDVVRVHRDVRDEPTVELPAVRAPRAVPAASHRAPATDW